MNAIILDTETHDMNGVLIELAWVNLNGTEEFNQRYNPDCKIVAGAMAVHHITDADVADMPLHTTATLPSGIEYVIGHNIDYDTDVLKRSNVDLTGIKAICTLALARKAFPEFKSHSIGALMYTFSEDHAATRETLKNAHSALADVRMTETILDTIIKKMGLSKNQQLLFIASEEARIPSMITFGKHKGTAISALPADYKRWLLGQSDLDPYLRKALTKAERDPT
jgi:exodeoxyribonuclease X